MKKNLTILSLSVAVALLNGCGSSDKDKDKHFYSTCGCTNEQNISNENTHTVSLAEDEVNLDTDAKELTQGNIDLTGKVEDSISGDSLEEATVRLYYNNILIREVQTDSSGIYLFENLAPQSGYRIETIIADYIAAQYNDIEIADNQEVQHLQTIKQVNENSSGEGKVSGTITGAVDGIGKSGLLISVRRGVNQHQGEIIATTTTQSNGTYRLDNLEAGNYTAEITGDGYQVNYITLQVLGGRETEQQNGTINPILTSGETRIVLTWGDSPSDLDSHLTGPIAGETERFHIFFYNGGDSNTNLDVDDTNRYGPETITIKEIQAGRYRYSVHDYSNQLNSHSTALSNSDALVKVYRGEGLVSEFHVPNQAGTLWSVFEIIEGEIHPINTMSYTSNFMHIQKPHEKREEIELFQNLPSK